MLASRSALGDDRFRFWLRPGFKRRPLEFLKDFETQDPTRARAQPSTEQENGSCTSTTSSRAHHARPGHLQDHSADEATAFRAADPFMDTHKCQKPSGGRPPCLHLEPRRARLPRAAVPRLHGPTAPHEQKRIRRAPSPRHRTAPIGAVCLLLLKREQDFQSTARQTQNSSILGMRATRAHGAFVVFLLF